jgi:drug/metabolite transporter (DMT)-like permease
MSTRVPTSTRSVSPADLGALLFLGAVWGGAFLAFRIASPEVGPVWAAEARIGLAAVAMSVLFGRRAWAAFRGRLGAIVFTGATFAAIPFALIAFAALTLPTAFGALLNASTPLFTAMVGAVVLGHRLSGRVIAGIAVGMTAVLVLVGWSPLPLGPDTLLAVAASLGAAFSYAVAGTFVRRRLPDVGGVELATGQLVSASIVLLPVAILSGAPGTPSPTGLAALVGVALVSTALAWPVFFRVLSHTTPTAASTVTFIVPAFGIVWGALALGEPVGPELVAGAGLILVSLVLVLGLPVGSWVRGGAVRAGRTLGSVRAVLALRGSAA